MASFEIDGSTQLVGLFGFPVEHSLSPAMHNAAFLSMGLNWRYHTFSVAPENLAEALLGVKALGIRGINATIPHKETLLALVDEVSPRGRSIGAINTVVVGDDGRLIGENTDAPGFVADLRRFSVEAVSHEALVLGAGGSARAVVYGLLEAACPRIHIANRTVARATRLMEDMKGAFPDAELSCGSLEDLPERFETLTLAVNTSSVGLKEDRSIWPESWPKDAIQVAYDLIYAPPETPFLRAFRERGCVTINGLGMLAEQGRLAWSLWTGRELDPELMFEALKKATQPSREPS